jgi:hypothetical protein
MPSAGTLLKFVLNLCFSDCEFAGLVIFFLCFCCLILCCLLWITLCSMLLSVASSFIYFVVVIFLQVCVRVLYCTLYLVTHSSRMCVSHPFSSYMWISRMYLCDMLRLIAVSVQIFTYFLFHTPHHQLPSCLFNQYGCCVRTGRAEGATGEIRKTIESAIIVYVYSIFQNDTMKVMVSNKYYDSF